MSEVQAVAFGIALAYVVKATIVGYRHFRPDGIGGDRRRTDEAVAPVTTSWGMILAMVMVPIAAPIVRRL